MSLISPSRCLPARRIARDPRLVRLAGGLSVLEEHLGEADDRVERRAQLVAHVGEELRLVVARDLELAALVLELLEQASILDGHRRLVRKRLEEVDRVGGGGGGGGSARG